MRNLLQAILCLISFLLLLTACENNTAKGTTVGIVIPLEHAALTDIVTGFKQELTARTQGKVRIIEKNAQGDINIQRAIIQQMRAERVALLVAVATSTTQMSIALAREVPVLGLASDITRAQQKALPSCNVAIVQDKIPPERILKLLHLAYPKIKNVALIHSADDKVMQEIKETEAAAKELQMHLTQSMAASLPELANVGRALPANTEAILILKDNLMASGITTLVKMASERHILLITSDQGTVINGAAFALSVHEKDIGKAGAKLAVDILAGQKACTLPIVAMKDSPLTVFVNRKAIKDTTPIIHAATALGYGLEIRD